jgi:hypothetical protein
MKRRECVLLNICGLFLYFSFSSAGAIERYDFELCGTEDVVSQNCEYHEQVAKKFWEYAIMAADTYRAIDSIEWKKRRVRNIFRNKDGAEKAIYIQMTFQMKLILLRRTSGMNTPA